tara:strand:+ start:6412 stop:7446 length:1035 start_codon:yes stop_codon:yes gene_type:complete
VDKNIVTPFISVIMPVYNCELYLKEAIDSILNQTYANFEFFIIDDASTDQTLSIIKAYDDIRINLVEKEVNSGLTKSLNIGLSMAKGKYIARMDGDDISLPERFAKQLSFLDRNPEYVLCGSNYSIIGSNQVVTLPETNEDIKLGLLKSCVIAHPSVMFRNSILLENNIKYDSSKEPAEDYHLWVQLISKGKFYNIQELLLRYRVHDKQISQKKFIQQRDLAVLAKIELLRILDFKLDDKEYSRLVKIIGGKGGVAIEDIVFFSALKTKILDANRSGFFDNVGFSSFLEKLETNVVRSFFLKKTRYYPVDFFNYLRVRHTYNLKFQNYDVFKLALKSFFLYKHK